MKTEPIKATRAFNAPGISDFATTPTARNPETAILANEKPAEKVNMVCDLAKAHAFTVIAAILMFRC